LLRIPDQAFEDLAVLVRPHPVAMQQKEIFVGLPCERSVAG
jgi:hypothetical protein